MKMKIKCRNIDPKTNKVCGHKNPSDAKFCEHCLGPLNTNNNPRIWPVLLIATLFVGVATYMGVRTAINSNKVEIMARSSDPNRGTVNGGGDYVRFDTVTLIAQANEGYRFVSWTDGNTDSIRKVVAGRDNVYEALFDSIPIHREKKAILDEVLETPRIPRFTITVRSADPDMGSVIGEGEYDSLAVANIEARPKNGYQFVSWDDGDKNMKRTVTVLSNRKFTARFQKIENKPVETYNLDWGNYAGPMKDGKPDGRSGKVTVTRVYDIVDASGNTITVYPGETITATKFDNGHLKSGEIHRKDGNHLLFMAD